MIPESNYFTLNENLKIKSAIKKILKSKQSHVPIYNYKNDIIGIVYLRDLLIYFSNPSNKDKKLKDIAKNPHFIPAKKKINILLEDYKKYKNLLFVVINEYGTVIGYITFSHILKEIVGEVYDDYEEIEKDFVKLNNKEYEIFGFLSIKEFNEFFKTDLIDISDEYDTIAGFFLYSFSKIPKEGDFIQIKNFKIIVTKVSRLRTIRKVKIVFD